MKSSFTGRIAEVASGFEPEDEGSTPSPTASLVLIAQVLSLIRKWDR